MIALGDFDRALALHAESLEIYTQIGEEDERAAELAALGGLYFRMGDAPTRARHAAGALSSSRNASRMPSAWRERCAWQAMPRRCWTSTSVALDIPAPLRAHRRESARRRAHRRTDRRRAARTRQTCAPPKRRWPNRWHPRIALVRASALEERARIRVARARSGHGDRGLARRRRSLRRHSVSRSTASTRTRRSATRAARHARCARRHGGGRRGDRDRGPRSRQVCEPRMACAFPVGTVRAVRSAHRG